MGNFTADVKYNIAEDTDWIVVRLDGDYWQAFTYKAINRRVPRKGRSALNEHSDYHVFRDVTRRRFVVDQRRMRKYVGPIFQGQAVQALRLAFKYVASMFSRNVGKQLPTEAKRHPRRAQISTLLRRTNLISTVRDSTMTMTFRVCYTSKHAIRINYEAGLLLILTFYFLWRCGPTQAMASSFTRFLDHTQRRTTVGTTPLDE